MQPAYLDSDQQAWSGRQDFQAGITTQISPDLSGLDFRGSWVDFDPIIFRCVDAGAETTLSVQGPLGGFIGSRIQRLSDVDGAFVMAPASVAADSVMTASKASLSRSAEANLDSNVTLSQANVIRCGRFATVSGRFTADPTLTATTTSFEMSLPIGSNIGAVADVAGVAVCGNIAAMCAEITGSIANNTAVVTWKATDVTSQTWSYTYTFEII